MKKVLHVVAVLTAAVLVLPIFGIAPHSEFPTEVQASASIDSALDVLCKQGIFEGFEDGQLHPELSLTRAQFAKILHKAFPKEAAEGEKADFSDVTVAHWAYSDIQKAVRAGWLNGFPDGSFRPEENITYEQAVTVLCRIQGLVRYEDLASYPEDYIVAAMEAGISDGVYALIGETISRAEAAILLLHTMHYAESAINRDVDRKYGNIPLPMAAPAATGAALPEMTLDSAMPNVESGMVIHDSVHFENTEEYKASEENVFKNVLTSPLSTFSIDADTASYSNLRRLILNGQQIPNGAVRSEELLNYFDYAHAETEDGKPFGVKYTVAECPWNTENMLAMITVSGEELAEPKPSNLVFLLDTSGSMYSANKLPLVKEALSMLLDTLGEQDTISIVTYASNTGVVLEPTPATEKEKIMDAIRKLEAGGATAGASGINLAYEQAEKNKIDGNNRIILCTDGDFNVGTTSEGDLEKLIAEKRESGIFLSVLGFGMGNYKDSRMEMLADKGNGNYAYIDNLREAKKVLVDEMPKTIYTIAKDVKIQVEFNPEQVGQYRLIGYENRLLNDEDFENDAKDAGELGAGASVTVLYEIVPASDAPQTSLKYQTVEGTGSDELMTVKIRYKLPEGEESILSEYPVSAELNEPDADFSFAAAVAELGMLLNESEFKGNATYDTVLTLAKAGVGEDRFGLRGEFVQLVDLLRYKSRS